MTGTALVLAGAFGLAVLAVVVWMGLRLRREIDRLGHVLGEGSGENGLSLMQQQIEALRQTLRQSLAETQTRADQRFDALARSVGERLEATRDTLDKRLGSTDQVVRDVKRSLGEVDASIKGVAQITGSIRELQDILKAPKLRGGLGEYFLNELLGQILPPSAYDTQYRFAGGERVDAVIHAGDRVVPVDAKFPLENFRRFIQATGEEATRRERRAFMADVKKHVDAIANKYIRPSEGTYDFALMYIPAENVYYEVVLRDDEITGGSGLLPYALQRRVIPVSPHSLYAYLQVILIGLQGLRIEAHARTILERLQSVHREFGRFAEDYAVVGRHLGNAVSKYDESSKKMDRFEDHLGVLTTVEEAGDAGPRLVEAEDAGTPPGENAGDLPPIPRTGEKR